MIDTDHNQNSGDISQAAAEAWEKARKLDEQIAQAEMPKYRCHKTVHALKIKAVVQSEATEECEGGSLKIIPEDEGYAAFSVPHEFITKHNPQAGGYFVVYDDGYKSFSPAKAFEDGYTRI